MSSPERPDLPATISNTTRTESAPSGASSLPEMGAQSPAMEPEAAGVAAPDVSGPPPSARPKTKGVADIVFLIDVSGSMKPCIDALRTNIEAFIDSLSKGEGNSAPPVSDWRGKVVGYRDVEAAQSEGLPWIVDHPFVRDATALKAQLSELELKEAAMSRSPFWTRCSKRPRWRRAQRAHSQKIRENGATVVTQLG